MDGFVKKSTTKIREDHPRRMLQLLVAFRGNDLEALMGELDAIIDRDYASSIEGTRPTRSSQGLEECHIDGHAYFER